MESFNGDGIPSKASKFAPENDVISRMLDYVITNILDRLPIQKAARADILSRNWRYKWTTLTQLVFGKKFFEHLIGPDGNEVCDGRSLSRLLLHFKGTITKFVLYIPNRYTVDAEDVNHWVLLVSRKGLQELDLFNTTAKPLKLPSQLFTCVVLKHLKLYLRAFRFLPSFRGFSNLLSLYLEQIKLLSLDLEQLMCLLPKLQELNLDFWGCKFIAEMPDANKKVPDAFLCLRDLKLSQVDFSCDNFVSFIIETICGSPILQTLEIMPTYKDHFTAYAHSSLDFDCNKMGQLQLPECCE